MTPTAIAWLLAYERRETVNGQTGSRIYTRGLNSSGSFGSEILTSGSDLICPFGQTNISTRSERPQLAVDPATGNAWVVFHSSRNCNLSNAVTLQVTSFVNGTPSNRLQRLIVALSSDSAFDTYRANLTTDVAYHAATDSWILAYAETDTVSSDVQTRYQAYELNGSQRTPERAFRLPSLNTATVDFACGVNCAFSSGNIESGVADDRILLNRFSVTEVPPPQGEVTHVNSDPVVIDGDSPTSSFYQTERHVQAGTTIVLGGTADDGVLGSGIAQVEISADNGTSWQAATGREAWSFAYAAPMSDGTQTLLVRATDDVGNVQTAAGQLMLIIDATPPQFAPQAREAAPVRGISFDRTLGRWEVSLVGQLADPQIAGVDGSGVASVEVRVEPNGSGWLPTNVLELSTGLFWFTAYPLAPFADDTQEALVSASGIYTVSVRATDQAGNTTLPEDYQTFVRRFDGDAPTVELTAIGNITPSAVVVITDTATVLGTLTEVGNDSAENSFMQYAFTDIEPFTDTNIIPNIAWQFMLPNTSSGGQTATWQFDVPSDVEGFFQIDVRGFDRFETENRAPSEWGHWRGEIDTRAPQITQTRSLLGEGASAFTLTFLDATDLNLSEAGVTFLACTNPVVNRDYYDSDFQAENSGDMLRLHQLTFGCLEAGHNTTPLTSTVCDAYGHCASVTTSASRLAGRNTDALSAVIFEPMLQHLATTLDPIAINGAAHADSFLQSLVVAANGTPVYTENWANGATLDDVWAFNWTPPASGIYSLTLTTTDWAGGSTTEEFPVVVIVDVDAPTVAISELALNAFDSTTSSTVNLTGTASDTLGIAQVEVRIDGGAWQVATLADEQTTATSWHFPIPLSEATFLASARVTDLAGQQMTVTETITVDVLPPDALTVTLAYDDGNRTVQTLRRYQTVTDASSLQITWDVSDGATQYFAGFTADAVADVVNLTAYNSAETHIQPAPTSATLYAHVVAVDAAGNQRASSVGPIYVDAASTPDLIDDLSYDGWTENGCTLLNVDHEIARTAPASAALSDAQRLFASWNADNLRLTWRGANWDEDGDLMLYLDTMTGGTMAAYDPYVLAAPALTLPFSADFLIHVEGANTISLRQWDGASWTVVTGWTIAQSAQMTRSQVDLLIPFTTIGNPTSLSLIGLASEEDQLRIWASAPNKQPLNSARVLSELALPYVQQPLALTEAITRSDLGSGVCVNGSAGNSAEADLHASLRASVAGTKVGYLHNDLFDLLTRDAPIDADANGVIDFTVPGDSDGVSVGVGQTLTYSLTIVNEGTVTAHDIEAVLVTHGGLQLNGDATLSIGSLAAGASVIVPVETLVVGGADSAELRVTLSDAQHPPFEWLWIHHAIDRAAPTNTALVNPPSFVRAGSNQISGVVQDDSAVPTIELEVTTSARMITIISCNDPTPTDGRWTCGWDATGALNGETQQLRVRAIDAFGNVGAWTAQHNVTVDTVAPTVAVDAATQQALADGILAADELLLTGLVVDNGQASGVRVCMVVDSAEICNTLPTMGAWAYQLSPSPDETDVLLHLYGRDLVGNESPAPLALAFTLDTAGPGLTVTSPDIIALSDLTAGVNALISGSIADSSGIAQLRLRLDTPQGDTMQFFLDTDGGSWAYLPFLPDDPSALGDYTMRLFAIDSVDNISSFGEYTITVVETVPTAIMLVASTASMTVAHQFAGWLTVILLATLWLLHRRRMY